MKVRIGISISPSENGRDMTYSDLRGEWMRAEEMGVDTLHVDDHFGDKDGGWEYEAVSLLAAMAEVTKRVEFGANIFANASRNPMRLAHVAATIDHISNGRFIMGIGSGGWQSYTELLGYVFGSPGDRVRAMGRSVGIIGERLAKLTPPPRRRIPMYIGTGGRIGLRIAAEHADIWNSEGDPDEMAGKNEILNAWCAEIGRDPSEIERSVDCWNEPHTVEHLEAYVEAGITHMILYPEQAGWETTRELLDWRDQKNHATHRSQNGR